MSSDSVGPQLILDVERPHSRFLTDRYGSCAAVHGRPLPDAAISPSGENWGTIATNLCYQQAGQG